jgi:hypothetical protein
MITAVRPVVVPDLARRKCGARTSREPMQSHDTHVPYSFCEFDHIRLSHMCTPEDW